MEYTPEEQDYLTQQQQAMTMQPEYQQSMPMQQLPPPNVPITRNSEFMTNLFNFKQEMLSPLIHLWRGEEEINPGEWELPDGDKSLAIMNRRGISWASGFIAGYANPIYVLSNYDENAMNDTMRKVVHAVWNTLAKNYEEYELDPIHIQRISLEIWSKVHAILLSCRGEGLRRFLTSTYNIDEVRTTTNQMPQQQKPGLMGIFGKKNQQQMPQPGTY